MCVRTSESRSMVGIDELLGREEARVTGGIEISPALPSAASAGTNGVEAHAPILFTRCQLKWGFRVGARRARTKRGVERVLRSQKSVAWQDSCVWADGPARVPLGERLTDCHPAPLASV